MAELSAGSTANLFDDTLSGYPSPERDPAIPYWLAPSHGHYTLAMLDRCWMNTVPNKVGQCQNPPDDITLGLCADHREELREATN